MTEADPARLAAGWERRFVADPRRAHEAAALYVALGFAPTNEMRRDLAPGAA